MEAVVLISSQVILSCHEVGNESCGQIPLAYTAFAWKVYTLGGCCGRLRGLQPFCPAPALQLALTRARRSVPPGPLQLGCAATLPISGLLPSSLGRGVERWDLRSRLFPHLPPWEKCPVSGTFLAACHYRVAKSLSPKSAARSCPLPWP